MPRFRRLVVPGYPHHVTQRGVRRQTTFFDDRDYRNYLAIAKSLRPGCSLQILAYCLMPNHIHAVVIPRHDHSLAEFFGKLHHQYAKQTNFRYEWTGHLWQNRFYSVVMNAHHAITAMRYVERNPVRSGLVKTPHEWPWSSARGNLGLVDDDLIPDRPALELVPDWAAYLSGMENDRDLRELRRVTGTGRPTGDVDFIETIESLSGRQIRKKSAGRRQKIG
jgi:putative transposase